MEFLIMIVIVGMAGGILGYLAGKKFKPAKNRKIEGLLLAVALGLAFYAALTVSKMYYMCVAVIAGELIGRMIPKNKA